MTRSLLVAATILTGLSAGLFATFSYAVMPGLRRTDDATFVETMRAVNVAILNPVFGLVFAGAAVATGMALATAWGTGARPWLVGGLVLYVIGAYVVTAAVNVPLNDALAAGTADPARLRQDFEATWVAFNHLRSLATVAAFVCAAVGATRV